METTLSAENCKTKKIDTLTRKSFSSKKSLKVSFFGRKRGLYL